MEPLNEPSRRNFLKNISIFAGTGLLAGTTPWFEVFGNPTPAGKGASDKIRIGIIGTGSRGEFHLNILKTIPTAEIAALCDDYESHLLHANSLVNSKPKTFLDYRDLIALKDIDAVIIATPLHKHSRIVIDALHAGKHVFCEKSMARNIEDCISMIKAQKETGLNLQIGHQRMFSFKYLKALEIIKSGQIGKISQIRAYWHRNNNWRRSVPDPSLERRLNWRLYDESSCGLMTELASHQIQVGNWYLNATPDYVTGSGSINYWKDGREAFDNVNVVYHYQGGIHLIYDSTTSNVHYGLEEQIMGDKGTLEPETGKVYLENPPPAPGIVQLITDIEHKVFSTIPLGGASWAPDSGFDKKGKPITDMSFTDENIIQMEAFIESVKSAKPVKNILKEGYNATIAALIGHEAMVKKEFVYWKPEYNFDSL